VHAAQERSEPLSDAHTSRFVDRSDYRSTVNEGLAPIFMSIQFRKGTKRPALQTESAGNSERPLRYRHVWQAVGWFMVAVVIWLSLTPAPPEPPPFLAWDKANHSIAYAGLMYWFWQAFQRHWRWPLFLFVLGVGLEVLQGLGGVRMLEPYDMIANSVGILIGLALAHTFLGTILAKIDALLSRKRGGEGNSG